MTVRIQRLYRLDQVTTFVWRTMATAEFYYDPLECTICLGSFKDPKILPCFHSFCLMCLEKHVQEDTVPANRYNLAYFTCPLCRKETGIPKGGVKAFQTNFYIDALKTNDVDARTENHPVGPVCGQLGSLDLHLGCHQPEKGQRGRDMRLAQNKLAEMRYGAAKFAKYLSDLKQDASDYARRLMNDATVAKKELERMRQHAFDLVNAAYGETLGNVEEALKAEVDRTVRYETEVDGLVHQADALAEKAEAGQSMKEDHSAISQTLKKLTAEYTHIINSVPQTFCEKKSLCLQLVSEQNIDAGSVFGKVLCQPVVSGSTEGQNPAKSVIASNRTGSAQDSKASDRTAQVNASSNSRNGIETTSPKAVQIQDASGHASDVSYDSDSSLDARSMPSLESDHSQACQMGQGAVGGAGVGATTSTLLEPRVVRSFDSPLTLDIKHIAPHTTSRQAWINFGQKEPTVYLFDVEGHHIKMVTTGGDAHDVTVLDENTLVVANPAQKRIKQVDMDPDDSPNMPGQHTYLLPFPATCITYSAVIRVLAVVGKNNMQILSTVSAQSQMIIHGQPDILTKPSSVAFSQISDCVVLAAADPGTKTVYIFVECSDGDGTFTRENMFTYQGEGLTGLAHHCNFQPVSVTGRDNLLAVLDRTTESVALLGQEFSLIGIVQLDVLHMPSPRCLAFTSNDSSCWQVWLGTAAGQIAIVDLPEFNDWK